MSVRYFSADFHFGSSVLLDKQAMGKDARKFSTLDEMHQGIIKACQKMRSCDTLIHLGDLACMSKDRQWIGLGSKSELEKLVNQIPGQKILIEGNHDPNNGVSTAGKLLVEKIGKWNVTLQHYPSNHHKALNLELSPPHRYHHINICGHVHNAWRVMYDKRNSVLNINVGLDRNNFKIYSESELVELITRAVAWFDYNDRHADVLSFDEWEREQIKKKASEARDKEIKSLVWIRDNKPELFTESKKSKLEKLLMIG